MGDGCQARKSDSGPLKTQLCPRQRFGTRFSPPGDLPLRGRSPTKRKIVELGWAGCSMARKWETAPSFPSHLRAPGYRGQCKERVPPLTPPTENTPTVQSCFLELWPHTLVFLFRVILPLIFPKAQGRAAPRAPQFLCLVGEVARWPSSVFMSPVQEKPPNSPRRGRSSWGEVRCYKQN